MRGWCIAVLAGLLAAPGGRGQGPVEIGGVMFEQVDPGEPFTEQPDPPQDWEPAAPSRAERAAGLMVFVPPDPGDLVPGRRPRAAERAASLSAFLTPGEDEPVWFGVRALADLRGLEAAVDTGGAPAAAEVRHIHCWPQRTGWRSRHWYMTPELLLPCGGGRRMVPARRGVLEEKPFDVGEGTTTGFWVTLSARPDAAPGVYEAAVTLSGGGREALRVPLRVEVLPFALQRPADRYWLLYADVSRWRRVSEAQVMAELRDFARHGFTGLVEMPLGTADAGPLPEGEPRVDAAAFRALARQCREAGLPGPHVVNMGGIPERVRKELGLTLDVGKDPWPEALRAGVEAVARAAVAATADEPARWLFYGVDEPSGDNTYAIQEYQCWHRGGAATYATFYRLDFLEKAAEFLTAPCFVSGLISHEGNARRAREGCERTGAEFWWYGTGSYVNPFPQERYMVHNRYGAGLLFWKAGAKAQVTWTFCRPHGDVFNDFDGSAQNSAEPKEQVTAYPHLLAPDDWSTYQGAIPTIAWEALREGADDYAYLHTATVLAREAAASPDETRRKAGERALADLASLAAAVPWANPMAAPVFKADRLQQVRRAAAGVILALRPEGAASGAAQGRSRRLQVEVRTTAAPAPAPSPVLAVLPAAAPPRVDGKADEAVWEQAVAANDFRDASTGGPAPAATSARVLYDEEALYIAFECGEPDMGSLRAERHGHDTAEVWLDDGVEVFVAGPARRPYAHVIVNTNGSVYDEVNQDPSWNPALRAAVAKGDRGWGVELAIPWADLAAAGVPRTPLMTLNLGRNRLRGAGQAPHMAWSCTFGGFHAPERFGLALLQSGPVALAGVELPGVWGSATLGVTLRNLSGEDVAGQAAAGDTVRTAAVPAGGTARLEIPLELRTAGARAVALSWGAAGAPPSGTAELTVDVPEPVAVAEVSGFVKPGERVEIPVALSIAAADRRRYAVQVFLEGDSGAKSATLRAGPGDRARLSTRVRCRAAVRVVLTDQRDGTAVSEARRTLFVLAE